MQMAQAVLAKPHNTDMICMSCRKREHEDCPGGSWCDCQHQPATLAGRTGSEPTLTWIRQG